MLLAELLAASERVAGTRSRLAKIDALAECLRRLDASEIAQGVAYLSGDTRQGRIGIGYAPLKDALAAAPASAPRLTLAQIDEALARLAQIEGKGSAAERARLLAELFASATAREQDFLARLLLGELRQGALEGIMLDAIAKAAKLPPERVRAAAMRAGGISAVAEAALTEGESGLARFALEVFRPVQPMLAQPAEDVVDAIERLGPAAFEWKLEGARVQAHKSGGQIRVYARSQNEVTSAVPEIVAALQECRAREVILDGETIALRPEGTPYPFQETMRRFGRKLDVEASRATYPLSVFFFDCLLAEGEDLTARPARERFDALAKFLPAKILIPRLVTGDKGAAQAFYDDALAPRPRGRHGEGAGGPVRGRKPRRRLAQDQKGAHARPRRHRGRMGQRPPQGLALQPAPRRARPRHRRLRDARQDLQRHDRQDARLADRAASPARNLARRPRRARAAGARRRDRVQRNPAELDLSRRLRAALRARQALPR